MLRMKLTNGGSSPPNGSKSSAQEVLNAAARRESRAACSHALSAGSHMRSPITRKASWHQSCSSASFVS